MYVYVCVYRHVHKYSSWRREETGKLASQKVKQLTYGAIKAASIENGG